MRDFYCHARVEVKDAQQGDQGGRYIEGYASTKDLDRDSDVIPPDAFSKTIETFLKNPIVFFNHMWGEGIGTVEKLSIDGKGLFVRIKLAEGTDLADKTWSLIKQGVYRALSFGFRILAYEDHREDKTTPYNRIITDLDLFEVSVVTVPANAQATFSLAKGLKYGTDIMIDGDPDGKVSSLIQMTENLVAATKSLLRALPQAPPEEDKGATSFANLPLADEGLAWSGSAAVKSLQKWASSDGSGDKDKVNWAKYSRGFLWFDGEDRENFGAYKLPFAQVFDGTLKAVPRGVMAAAGVMRGARGGANVPDEDKPKIISHIEQYYKKMGKESPFTQRSFDLDAEEFGYAPIKGIEDEEPQEQPEEEEKRGRVISAATAKRLRECDSHVSNAVTAVKGGQALLKELLDMTEEAGAEPSEEKRGRVISAENRARLQKCFDHVKEGLSHAGNCSSVLKELLKMHESGTPMMEEEEEEASASPEGTAGKTAEGLTPGSESQSQPGTEGTGTKEQQEQVDERAAEAIAAINGVLKDIATTLETRSGQEGA